MAISQQPGYNRYSNNPLLHYSINNKQKRGTQELLWMVLGSKLSYELLLTGMQPASQTLHTCRDRDPDLLRSVPFTPLMDRHLPPTHEVPIKHAGAHNTCPCTQHFLVHLALCLSFKGINLESLKNTSETSHQNIA